MTDTLTQIQKALDQLNTQLYASIRYINTHHSPLPLPSSSSATSPTQQAHNSTHVPPPPLTNGQPAQQQQPPPNPTQLDATDTLPPGHVNTPAPAFAAAQKELAHDLILKSQQIQGLIDALPGVERGKEDQEGRIRELESVLKEARRERQEAERERLECVERVERVLGGISG